VVTFLFLLTLEMGLIHTHLPALIAERDAIFPALLAALLCLVVVSAVTKPPDAEKIRQFHQQQ